MIYKKCPKCELNYITDDEELCKVCKGISILSSPQIESDFSKIIRGHVYGSNSREIYERFCDSLQWDKNKSSQFGRQNTPLYASKVDKDKVYDVWFICYPNFDINNIDNVVEDNHVTNIIQDNGDIIGELFKNKTNLYLGEKRITFVKNDGMYEFYGVYETVDRDETMRIYKRISDIYPII